MVAGLGAAGAVVVRAGSTDDAGVAGFAAGPALHALGWAGVNWAAIGLAAALLCAQLHGAFLHARATKAAAAADAADDSHESLPNVS